MADTTKLGTFNPNPNGLPLHILGFGLANGTTFPSAFGRNIFDLENFGKIMMQMRQTANAWATAGKQAVRRPTKQCWQTTDRNGQYNNDTKLVHVDRRRWHRIEQQWAKEES